MSSGVLVQVKKTATVLPSSPIITPFQTLLGHQTSPSFEQSAPPQQQNEPATLDRVAFPLPAPFGHNFTSIPIRATVSETPQTKQETPKVEDVAEHEAEHIAEHITPTATSGSSSTLTPLGDTGSGDDTPSSKRGNDTLSHVTQVIDSGNGQPLDSATRASMEQQFGHNFSNVRVHTNTQAATSTQAMNALAYTVGPNIVFNRGQYTPQTETGKRLLAHELTHVVQQSQSLVAASQPQLFNMAQPQWKQPALQKSTGLASTNAFEREAHQASNAVIRGERIHVFGRVEHPWIQRQDISSAQPAPQADTSNTAQQTQPQADNSNSESSSWTWAAIEKAAWVAIREYAPDLEPIIHQGVASWLEEKITNALQSAFDTLMAPVRAVTGVVQELSAHFSELLVWMQGAAEKISRGDCSAITEATAKIQQVVDGFASPIIDRIKQIASKVGDFFKGIWDQFGAPIWEWLKKVGGEAWEKLQSFGAWVWDKTAPIRDLGARAWKWLKDKIGIGDGPEGQNGLLQWVQNKASEVWEKLKQKLEPIKKPLMVVGAILLWLSPAGPLIAVGAIVGGLIVGIKWIREHLSTPDGVVNARVMLQKVIIPQIMNSIKGFTGKLTEIAHDITDKLNKVMGGLGSLIGVIGQSVLSFIVSAIQWIADTFQGLVTWANEKLTTLVNWVTTGLERLHAFLQPVLDVLAKVAEVFIDILKLPVLLLQGVWHKIPACIRDPFVNFLVKQILGRIPIVKSIIAIPNIWEKLKERAMTIIHQIFQQGDLTGAMLSIFKLLLEVLNIPLELVTGIFIKAANAFDLIMKDPIGFLKNILGAIKQGFGLFFQHIGTHLLNGAADWLFGDLEGKGLNIRIPKEFSLGPIFTFVIDVLGITAEHIWEKLEKKLDPELVKKLKAGAKALGKAWEWIGTLITEGPAGLWRMLTEKLSSLWNTLLNGVIGWINTKIIKGVMTWLLGFLDPTGIMEIIETLKGIYAMIQSAVKYALKLLRVLNTILDSLINIAQGVLGPVAAMFEGVLARMVPVALGFLANLLDIDDIGDSIKDIVDAVREKVDEGLDWLIDKAIALGKGILNALGVGGGDDKKEDEKDKTGDVRGQAKKAIEDRVKDGMAKPDVDIVLSQILEEMSPLGVKQLETGPEDEEGNYDIQIEASPLSKLFKMISGMSKGPMKSAVTITFKENTDVSYGTMTGLLDPGKRIDPKDLKTVSPSDDPGYRRIEPPGGLGASKSGAAVMPSKDTPNKIVVLSRATGDSSNKDATSHAEYYFCEWIEQQPWMKDIVKIEIVNDPFNPCKTCADRLVGLRKKIVALSGRDDKELTTITWSGNKPWSSMSLAEVREALNTLHNANWKVIPDDVPPEGIRYLLKKRPDDL